MLAKLLLSNVDKDATAANCMDGQIDGVDEKMTVR